MAIPYAAGTFKTYESIGNREDLSDIIYDISPTETPFLSMSGRGNATQRAHEWQTDSLAAAALNVTAEGDDAAANTAVATVRVSNQCQILTKAISVSGTQEAVNKAGRRSEMAYQTSKRAKELKRDLEFALTRNTGASAGASGTGAQMAGIESWLSTNRTTLAASTAAATTPGWSTAFAGPTDGSTAGTMTGATAGLLPVIQQTWNSGGNPRIIMCGPFNKRRISTFAGIATLYKEVPGAQQGVITSGADVYISDFGEHTVVPNRFSRDATILLLDFEYLAVAYLRPFQQLQIARTGDAIKRQLVVECTLQVRNEASSGKITDLVTS
jgi:hypothetical protein